MERVELDEPYEIATLVARLQDRARRRLAVQLGATGGVAVLVMIVAFVLGDGRVAAPAIVFAAVFAIGSGRNALGGRASGHFRIGPVGGLPFRQRRRVMRGVRHGRLDDDPLLHEVQLVEVGRLHDLSRRAWLLPVLVVCWSVEAAVSRSVVTMAFFTAAAILFAIVSTRVFVNLRGVKRILAAG